MSKIKLTSAVIAASMLLFSTNSLVKAEEFEEFTQEQEQTIEWELRFLWSV